MPITCTNLSEVLSGMAHHMEKVKAAQMTAAKQMGIVAKQAMQAEVPPHIVTSHWQKSINYHVERISDAKVLLVVGSNGAERYYFIREALDHPISIGWHKCQPQLTDIYQNVITEGLGGRSVTQNISSSNIDEFASMSGF